LQKGLLEQDHAEAGLARARHTDNYAMSGEVRGFVVDIGILDAVVGAGIDFTTDKQMSGWYVLHGHRTPQEMSRLSSPLQRQEG